MRQRAYDFVAGIKILIAMPGGVETLHINVYATIVRDFHLE
jgi:hypothetical protein